MFDINHVLARLEGKFSPETINGSVQGLVNRGILEQYTDENGDFKFQLTELGMDVGQAIINDPMSLFDLDEEEDGIV